jgi:endogenous inhibitor of DNA gyrase (YacG/DUF329 family)
MIMETIKVLCPKCGGPVVLAKYGLYLDKEFKRFTHIFEGWCPDCVERVVLSSADVTKGKETKLKVR